MTACPILSIAVFAPWAGALLLALIPRPPPALSRALALVASLSTLVAGFAALARFDPNAAGYQLVERHVWVSALNAHYYLGLDGLSLILVLLTGVVAPAGLLASWRQPREVRLFGILFLLLQGCALGVFLALDFFHWFLFWELSLIPAFFLIKLWGGPGPSSFSVLRPFSWRAGASISGNCRGWRLQESFQAAWRPWADSGQRPCSSASSSALR
jgi:NADH-quinone oxidoreductase subunit M